jgi:hypothetical protein
MILERIQIESKPGTMGRERLPTLGWKKAPPNFFHRRRRVIKAPNCRREY